MLYWPEGPPSSLSRRLLRRIELLAIPGLEQPSTISDASKYRRAKD